MIFAVSDSNRDLNVEKHSSDFLLNVIGDCHNDDKCPPRQITAGSELQNKCNYRG